MIYMDRVLYGTPLQDEFFKMYGEDLKIDDQKICEMFGRKPKKEPKFLTSDRIKIGQKESKFVKDGTETTIGIFVFNKVVLEHMEIFGYYNGKLDGDILKNIQKKLSRALEKDDITAEQFSYFIDRTQYLFGGILSDVINSSLASEIMSLPPGAKKLRAKLLSENMEELKKGNPEVSAKIEKEICAVAKDEIRRSNPEAMDLFDAKCGVDFDNNYKTMFVMKGAVQDNTGEWPTGYKVITSNYDVGITKEDFSKYADTLVGSAYAKGKLTAVDGYSTKKYNALFQNIHLGKRGSDCGTTQTKKVFIEPGSDKYLYRYIMVNKKPIMLTDENISKYYGKTVDMRTPLYCKAKDGEYCNKCYGERKYILDLLNVGLTYNIATNSILNGNMKTFHDVTIKLYQLDIENDIMSYLE